VAALAVQVSAVPWAGAEVPPELTVPCASGVQTSIGA
jgi:hypothetical protein